MHNYLSYIADKISQPIRQRLLLLCIIDYEKIFLELTHFFFVQTTFSITFDVTNGMRYDCIVLK